ncbi:hypothetical protein RN001_002520 [Aquatica leii]|uniref:Uncharacterized protein n=1 Tax=Aquatica leii TaxID=1421715 RepID=A0AAN7Q5F5_9COLE|nr:hypothetical protein RN001_002520 [Aquatica leii]
MLIILKIKKTDAVPSEEKNKAWVAVAAELNKPCPSSHYRTTESIMDSDKLYDVMNTLKCKTIIAADNINKTIDEIGHKEIVQKLVSSYIPDIEVQQIILVEIQIRLLSMNLIYSNITIGVILITLLSFVRGISYQCPLKCVCNETIVKCNKRQLTSISDFNRLYFNPTTINLSENKIEEVLERHFYSSKLKTLKYLQLNDNNILNVQETSFVSLLEIEYIDLSNNQLDDIPSEIIQKNTRLLELNLSNNLFGSNTPTIISKSLLILDLSSCKLTVFSEDNFKATPNLQALFLHVNNLQQLDYHMFKQSNLKFLDIAYNPWKCHCDTVKLFEHLIKYGLTALKGNVQCMHSNKLFEDIYGNTGEINTEFCNRKPLHISSRNSIENSINYKQEINKENQNSFENHETNINAKENIIGFIMHFEVLIIVGIVSVLLVVSLITLAVVVRKTTPNQRVIYGKIPT